MAIVASFFVHFHREIRDEEAEQSSLAMKLHLPSVERREKVSLQIQPDVLQIQVEDTKKRSDIQ